MISKKHDLDERGLCGRDKIDGDVLTLVGFKNKKRRRVKLEDYLSGEFKSGRMRRDMGWILPSLDGDPPHAQILACLLLSQANAAAKKKRIEENRRQQEEATELRRVKKEATHAAWLVRRAGGVAK